MRKLSTIFLGILIATLGVRAQETKPTPTASQPSVRFAAVDIYLDSKDQSLAAYQFELSAKVGKVKIVGIEGGEHAAFSPPPYYDPEALSRDRILIAAFNTGRDLPKGETRIARIHLQIIGEQEPVYMVKLIVAGSVDGNEIPATVFVGQGEIQ